MLVKCREYLMSNQDSQDSFELVDDHYPFALPFSDFKQQHIKTPESQSLG